MKNRFFLLISIWSALSIIGTAWAESFYENGADTTVLNHLKSEADSLSVFWWNTASADLDANYFPTYGKNVLEENLLALAQSTSAPDLLILGEFYAPHMQAAALEQLKKVYPFYEEFPYNADGSPLSIAVFSKYLMKYTYQPDAIDWAPPYSSMADILKYKSDWATEYNYPNAQKQFTRSFQSVKVQKNNKSFVVVPAHIAEPWYMIRAAKGSIVAGAAVLFGTDNPYYYGVLNFKNALKNLENRLSSDDREILVGDFNIPSRLYGFSPVGYQELVSGLEDIVFDDPNFTYPAASAPKTSSFPNVNLDHGFLGQNAHAEKAVTPRLIGSDHYPIYIIVR